MTSHPQETPPNATTTTLSSGWALVPLVHYHEEGNGLCLHNTATTTQDAVPPNGIIRLLPTAGVVVVVGRMDIFHALWQQQQMHTTTTTTKGFPFPCWEWTMQFLSRTLLRVEEDGSSNNSSSIQVSFKDDTYTRNGFIKIIRSKSCSESNNEDPDDDVCVVGAGVAANNNENQSSWMGPFVLRKGDILHFECPETDQDQTLSSNAALPLELQVMVDSSSRGNHDGGGLESTSSPDRAVNPASSHITTTNDNNQAVSPLETADKKEQRIKDVTIDLCSDDDVTNEGVASPGNKGVERVETQTAPSDDITNRSENPPPLERMRELRLQALGIPTKPNADNPTTKSNPPTIRSTNQPLGKRKERLDDATSYTQRKTSRPTQEKDASSLRIRESQSVTVRYSSGRLVYDTKPTIVTEQIQSGKIPFEHWIFCSLDIQKKDSYDMQGNREGELQNAWKAHVAKRLETKKKPTRSDAAQVMIQHKLLSGKWMLHVPPYHVDRIWLDSQRLMAQGRLGPSCHVMKVACVPQDRNGFARYLICVYVEDFTNKAAVDACLQGIRSIYTKTWKDEIGQPLEQRLYFKADGMTSLGIYSGNPWKMPISFYSHDADKDVENASGCLYDK